MLVGWVLRQGVVLDELRLASGPAETSIALLRRARPDLADLPVMAAGLVPVAGQPPALSCPVAPAGLAVTVAEPGLAVLPPLVQAAPPGRLGWEVARLAGFLDLNPRWDGVICLPGRRSSWLHVSAGELISFQSFLSGEIADLLTGMGSLAGAGTADWSPAAFDAALDETLSRPERLAGRLAELALPGAPDVAARLEGYLLGAELAAARPYWLGQQVAVIADGTQGRGYVTGLERQGVPVMRAKGARLAQAGFAAAWTRSTGAGGPA